MADLNTGAAVHEGSNTLDIERLAEGIMRFLALLALLLALALVWTVRLEPTAAISATVSRAQPELDREWLRQRPNESLDGMYRASR